MDAYDGVSKKIPYIRFLKVFTNEKRGGLTVVSSTGLALTEES
jgi:hypothetical protein